MPRIFLSYSQSDRDRVAWLERALSRSNMAVFWDLKNRNGENWRARLNDELSLCDALIVAWTSQSVDSEWVKWEAQQALAASKPVFFVRFEKVDPPEVFAEFNVADLCGWVGHAGDARLQRVLRDMETRLQLTEYAFYPTHADDVMPMEWMLEETISSQRTQVTTSYSQFSKLTRQFLNMKFSIASVAHHHIRLVRRRTALEIELVRAANRLLNAADLTKFGDVEVVDLVLEPE